MRSINRRQLLVVVVALMCLTALPGASSAAGGGDVRMPSNHTDFGTGDEPAPEVLENFSVGGSGDSASLSGPVGGTTKGGGLVSSGDTISWSESSPSTSESVINVTGVTNTQNNLESGVAEAGSTSPIEIGGNADPTGPESGDPRITVTAPNNYTEFGSNDQTAVFWGQRNGNQHHAEVGWKNPTDRFSAVEIYTEGMIPSDTTGTVDIYVVKEAPDGTFGEGTKVKSDWAPPTSSGWQTIDLGQTFDPNGGSITVEFVSSGFTTGNAEWGDKDNSASENYYSNSEFGLSSSYVRAKLTPGTARDLSVSTASDSGDLGTLNAGETLTAGLSVSNSDTGLEWTATNGGNMLFDWTLNHTARTQTSDPVVELNGDSSQQISIDGSVAGGQTVTKEIDNSWLESGENTATVTLNDSGLDADDPPMEAKVSVEKPAQSARYVSAAYDNLSRSNGVGIDWSGSGTLDVTVQGWTGSSWEDARQLSTSETGDVVLDYEPIEYGQTRVEIVANDNVEIREESIQFFTSTPEIGSATPSSGDAVSESPVELSINVSDADFGTIQGDEVDVTFYDGQGNQLDTDTISSDGTATGEYANPTGGANEWYVEATDSYANTVSSQTFTFNAPSEVEVRAEQTGELLTDADVTLEFYQQSSSPDNIEEIPVTDGTADMTGLPAGESFIAVADAEGYSNRRIFIDSLIETQTIYLLNESADSVTVEYELEDFSGNYPQAETVMIVERNINGKWTPIQGDFFGAAGKFEAQLLRDTRHRMRVVNLETGEERVAGTVTPQQSATETVTILPDGSITVDRGLEQIHAQPAIGSISATQAAEFGVDIQEGDQEITSWEIEIVLMNGTTETTLATRTGSGTGVETFDLDLAGADGGTVMAVVDYQTPERSGTVRLSREVRENYAGAEGLLGGLITIGDGLGAGDDSGPSSASMMASLFISLLVTGGVARVSTSADVMGISALMSVTGFAILGWVPMSLLFAATVGFGAMIALRRGI